MTSVDEAARRRALDPERSFCVTAPAGSGKTELLTQRILALLPRVERPEQVLAITFTRKAAAEMRERLMEKLAQAQSGDVVSQDHEQLTRDLASAVLKHARERDWVLDAEQFNIRTIDSLCGELTRQMPVLSGLGGGVEVTEQHQDLFARAVHSLLEKTGDTGSTGAALRALLLHFDNNWERLADLLTKLLERRGDWATRLGMHHSPEAAEASVRAAVEAVITSVLYRATDKIGALMSEWQWLANFAADNLGEPPVQLTPAPEFLSDWRRALRLLLTAGGDWRKAKGFNKNSGFPAGCAEEKQRVAALLLAVQEREVLEQLLEIRVLPEMGEQDLGWQLVLHLSHLLPILQAELLLVFQQEGRVDYTHIALAAEDALGPDDAPTDLALRLDYRIEHILVDEFQDTSDQQYRLLTRLTRGWAEHNATDAAPRTLFIVGDGMQSIYGFRYANVSLFLRAQREGVGGVELEALELKRNFRSQQRLVDWVNQAFARLLPGETDAARGRVSHVWAEAHHPAGSESPVSTRLFPDDGSGVEAQSIAASIQNLRRQAPDSSIAVLVRARSHAGDLIDALRQLDIPLVGRDLEHLAHSPAVQDLVSLCRWLANPADNIAALAILRAPYCGLSLATIQTLLRDQPRPFSLRQALRGAQGLLDPDETLRAEIVLQALDWAVDRRDRLSLPVWVEQVWLRLGGFRILDDAGCSDADRFFQLLREAEVQAVGLDIDWLERRLERLFAEHPVEGNPVQIMTLHKSKGLQFDYVFLPQLHRGVRRTERELLRWHLAVEDDGEGFLIAADDQLPGDQPSLYSYLNWLQKQKEEAELRRLLYVGITRARYRVFLSAQVALEDPAPGFKWPGLGTPIGILRPAIEEDAELLLSRGDGDGASGADGSPSGLFRLSHQSLASHQAGLDDDKSPGTSGRPESDRLAVSRTDNLLERSIGTAVHRGLELLAQRNTLPHDVDDLLRASLELALHTAGLPPDQMAKAVATAEAMLATALADDRGRWLLSPHLDAHCELSLYRGEDNAVCRVVDRTFVDDSGDRWVIDYKTSRPDDPSALTEFLECQTDKYRDQLQEYQRLLSGFDDPPRRVRMALYFPALPCWLPLDE